MKKLFTEEQVESLLCMMDPISISVKKSEVAVVVTGKDLGYDDGQYYKLEWFPADEYIESSTYKDARLTKFVCVNSWSEAVTSLENFAAVINGNAEGNWE
jgi:hypothetical protein